MFIKSKKLPKITLHRMNMNNLCMPMTISRTLKHWKKNPVILEIVLNFCKTDLALLSEDTFNVLEQLLEPFLDNFFPLFTSLISSVLPSFLLSLKSQEDQTSKPNHLAVISMLVALRSSSYSYSGAWDDQALWKADDVVSSSMYLYSDLSNIYQRLFTFIPVPYSPI